MTMKALTLFLCLCTFQGALSSISGTIFQPSATPQPSIYAPCNLDCQNNGTCVFYDDDYSLGAYCYCPTGYTGEFCQISQEECNGFICHNEGVCYNGTCLCPDPFTGPSCCKYSCNLTCLNNGTCQRNPQSNSAEYCECPYGYSGTYCEIPQEVCDYYICHNGGTCQDGICYCPPPYTGFDCRAECGIICENNGQCVFNNRYNFSYCVCEQGFTGERCEVELEVCGRRYYGDSDFEYGYYGQEGYDYCYNNGTCYNGSCVCEEPYSGPSCCSYNCSLPCQNGGECRLGLYDNSEYCECPYGYSGLYCEQAQEVCDYYICHNGGTCQDGICYCPLPYTGFDCRAECGIICENNGQCVFNNRYNFSYCTCEEGFTGERCEVEQEVCGRRYYGDSDFEYGYYGQEEYDYCYNNGTCYNGRCVCEEPYSGPSCCSYNCSLPCQNGGECRLGLYDNSEYCECPYGYSGLYCEQALETCGHYLCLNNGTCVNGTCSCPYPYIGADCAFSTCDLPCVNNGSCLGYMDHQFCVCPYPYFGEFCQFPQVVQVSFQPNLYEVVEGGTANVTVRVDGDFGIPFDVTLLPNNGTAIAPGDFDASPITMTFQPNGRDYSVGMASIDIADDLYVELTEDFSISLITPEITEELAVILGTPYVAQLSILDNDGPLQVSLESQNYTITEGYSVNLTLHVIRSHEFDFTVTLQTMDGSAVAGDDYVAGTYNVSFSAGQMYATLTVYTLDDNITELSEYFKVVIVSTDRPDIVEIGSPNMTVITIEDNDPALQVWFDPQNYTVTEGDTANITLVTSSSAYMFDFTVTLQTMDGSAVAGSDYLPGPYTVSFSAGQMYAILMVSPIDDDVVELSEYFTVMIDSTDQPSVVGIGSPNMSFITIQDNEPAVQVSFSPQNYTVTEGGVVNITLVAMFPAGGYEFDFTVTLQYLNGSATAGDEFITGPYSVSFIAGQASATVMVSTVDDSFTELPEYFTVVIASTDQPSVVVIGSPDEAFITIEDNDPALQVWFDPQNYTVTEGDAVNITLVTSSSAYMFDFTVTLLSMDGSAVAPEDYVPGPYTVSFSAGQASAILMVTTIDDVIVELSEYFTVVIDSTDQPSVVGIGSPDMSFITIQDNEPDLEVFFDRTSYTVPESTDATLTLRTSTPSYGFPFMVFVDTANITATADEDYTPGGYTVNFQPGQAEAMLTIPTMDDSLSEIDEVYRATIVSTSEVRVMIGSPDVANVTILDNEGGLCRAEVGPTGIMWPDTPVGQTATQPCLCEASQSNNATRFCGSNGMWARDPDDTLCQLSFIIENLCPAVIVSDQIVALTNISLMEDLNLTTGDTLLLTETVNDVIEGGQINSTTAEVLVSVLDEVVAAVGEDASNTDFGEMVLDTLDRVADAFLVVENDTIMEENVVVEVVSMMQSILQLNGLRANQLGGGNVVTLPPALFSLPGIPSIPRITAVSINNRNLVPPRNRNSRLRANILSVNLVNGPSGGLNGLRNNERIRMNFGRDTNTNDVANGDVSCVFYDTAAGDWSTEGCEMVSEDANSVTCECNHLTAFSILQSPVVPTISAQPLTLIITLSVVGGTVLLILLAIGGAYMIWRSRRKTQADLKMGEL